MVARTLRVGVSTTVHVAQGSRVRVPVRVADAKLTYTGAGTHNYVLTATRIPVPVAVENTALTYIPAGGLALPSAPADFFVTLQGQANPNSSSIVGPPTYGQPTEQSISLGWPNATAGTYSIAHYEIDYSTDGGSTWNTASHAISTAAADGQGTRYKHASLTAAVSSTYGPTAGQYLPATTYLHRIRAVDTQGNASAWLVGAKQYIFNGQGGGTSTTGCYKWSLGNDLSSNYPLNYNVSDGTYGTVATIDMSVGTSGYWLPPSGGNYCTYNQNVGATDTLFFLMKLSSASVPIRMHGEIVGDLKMQPGGAPAGNLINGGQDLNVLKYVDGGTVTANTVQLYAIPRSHFMVPPTGFNTQTPPGSAAAIGVLQNELYKILWQAEGAVTATVAKMWLGNANKYTLTAAKIAVPAAVQNAGLTYSPSSPGFTPQSTFTVTPATSFAHGNVMTVSRSSGTFPTHGNFNPGNYSWLGNTYKCYLAKSFENGVYNDNGLFWNTGGAQWDVVTSTTVAPPTNLTKCARQRGVTSRQGELQMGPTTNPTDLYVGFKFRLGSTYNGKNWRSWGSADSIYFATNGTSAGGSDLTGSNNEAQDVFSSPDSYTSGWNHWEMYNKLSGSIQVQTMLNAKNQWNRTGSTWSPGNISGHTLDLGNLLEVGDTGYFADYFIDYSNYVFYIHNNSVLSSSTKREFQVPVGTLGTTSWDLAINRGEFTSLSGLYLSGYDHATQTQTLIGQFT